MKTTDKFTGRAQVYAAARPAYPEALIDHFVTIAPGGTLVDAGSGTGILSRQLLEKSFFVYGVEPNEDMRREAEKALSGHPRFVSVTGTAEHTGLPDKSADLVTAAQAFHWFDADAFRLECSRILKPGGNVALIWNSRVKDSLLNLESARILRQYCPDFRGFSGGMDGAEGKIAAFFGGEFTILRYLNDLVYDEKTFVDRLLSASYSLQAGDADYNAYIADLKKLFGGFAQDGALVMPNETTAYIGQ